MFIFQALSSRFYIIYLIGRCGIGLFLLVFLRAVLVKSIFVQCNKKRFFGTALASSRNNSKINHNIYFLYTEIYIHWTSFISNSHANIILRHDFYFFVQVFGWALYSSPYPLVFITYSHRLGVYRCLQGVWHNKCIIIYTFLYTLIYSLMKIAIDKPV